MRGLIVLAMVFVKILLMDFSVIVKLDSSGLIANQVWFVLQMGLSNVVADRFFSFCLQHRKTVCYTRVVCRLLPF